jgi:hypothetical protein
MFACTSRWKWRRSASRRWGIDPGAACSLRFALAPGYPLAAPSALLRFALSYLLPPSALHLVPHRAFGVGPQERRRRGQKVARGKRAARSPGIASNKKFRPGGPTENSTVHVAVAPAGLARVGGLIQGAACSLRCALAPGYPLAAPSALLRFALSYLLPPWAVLRLPSLPAAAFSPPFRYLIAPSAWVNRSAAGAART